MWELSAGITLPPHFTNQLLTLPALHAPNVASLATLALLALLALFALSLAYLLLLVVQLSVSLPT